MYTMTHELTESGEGKPPGSYAPENNPKAQHYFQYLTYFEHEMTSACLTYTSAFTFGL